MVSEGGHGFDVADGESGSAPAGRVVEQERGCIADMECLSRGAAALQCRLPGRLPSRKYGASAPGQGVVTHGARPATVGWVSAAGASHAEPSGLTLETGANRPPQR